MLGQASVPRKKNSSSIIIPILQMEKLRHKAFKSLVQCFSLEFKASPLLGCLLTLSNSGYKCGWGCQVGSKDIVEEQTENEVGVMC